MSMKDLRWSERAHDQWVGTKHANEQSKARLMKHQQHTSTTVCARAPKQARTHVRTRIHAHMHVRTCAEFGLDLRVVLNDCTHETCDPKCVSHPRNELVQSAKCTHATRRTELSSCHPKLSTKAAEPKKRGRGEGRKRSYPRPYKPSGNKCTKQQLAHAHTQTHTRTGTHLLCCRKMRQFCGLPSTAVLSSAQTLWNSARQWRNVASRLCYS